MQAQQNQSLERITFDDVFGLKEEIEELKTIFDILSSPDRYTKYGAILPKGIIMSGMPGTGKTLVARALANEYAMPFYPVMAGDVKHQDENRKAEFLAEVFEMASNDAPAVIFIDELDSFLGITGYREWDTVLMNQLLTLMDGFHQTDRVMVLAATNMIHGIPKSLLRPGRFDKQVRFDYPTADVRKLVLQSLTKQVALDATIDSERLSHLFTGRSIAEIRQITSDAIIKAVREDRHALSFIDFIEAVDRHALGITKKTDKRKEEHLRRIAYHEAGHTLIHYVLKGGEGIVKVSIAQTSETQGALHHYGHEVTELLTKEEILDMLKISLGGAVSEEVVFGDISTGCQHDLAKASDLAEAMTWKYGMGRRSLRIYDGEILFSNKVSQKNVQAIDKEIDAIIGDAQKTVRKAIKKNKTILNDIAQQLLDKKVLMKSDVDDIMSVYKMISATSNA